MWALWWLDFAGWIGLVGWWVHRLWPIAFGRTTTDDEGDVE